ncbi:hypothetical protein ACFLQY_04680 [Verrucomicrobiota bacterium]
MKTDEKRKAGPCSIWGGMAVGLVLVFELAYIVLVSLPDGVLFSRFSPKVSAEDIAMLQANIPGQQAEKKAEPAVETASAATNAVTAVDAVLEKSDAVTTNAAPEIIEAPAEVEPAAEEVSEEKAVPVG